MKPAFRTLGMILMVPLHMLTGVAGFWLRRSWKNASLFAGLWLILAALQRGLDWLIWSRVRNDIEILELPSSYFHLKSIYLAAVLGLAIVSLVCFVRRMTLHGVQQLATPWVAVMLGVLAVPVTYVEMRGAWQDMVVFLRQGLIEIDRAPENVPRRLHRDVRFAKSAMWGDPVFLPYWRDGVIKGRALFEGKPVQVNVVAYLNGHYRTPVTKSDVEGYFALPAPRGPWAINRISARFRPEQSMGEDVVLTVLGPDKRAPAFDDDFFGEVKYKGQLSVTSVANPEHDELTLVLRHNLDVIWPAYGQLRQPASLSKRVVHWQPVQGAAEYRVTIHEYSGDSARPILHRTVVRPELPLKSLPTTGPATLEREYYVQVRAFTAEGELLTLSKSEFMKTSFVIDSGHALIPEPGSPGRCD